MWLLDTNTCIRYLNPAPSPVRERLLAHPVSAVVICDIVKAELYYGAYKSQRVDTNLELLVRFFAQIHSLPFDERAAQQYGNLRAMLERQGRLIGPYDLQIAAIALVHHARLVTHNTAEFSRVPGLALEDWEID
jgi:tRNA(fMet)-specific endonuclease VapC